ncbi:MAG: inositol monophosphatase [Desulfobacula sp. RIFOXYB2_FULL_45_6]|nr:MAG: inositol monophosphatase [Desulfobacula sp. RIFOXYB2_FULL_45_6]
MKQVQILIRFLIDLIKEAGDICKDRQNRLLPVDVDFKNRKDIVTTVDKEIENFISKKIRKTYASHDIYGEETGRTGFLSDYVWIIDPIDGTTSFLHQQPFYSTSIAIEYQGRIICGAVYAPNLNELFYADIDDGAFLNGRPIHVSNTQTLINSVMATGFACLRADAEHNNLSYFNKIVPQLRDIRRFGSAAIDLCYVACGKLDGYWEMNVNQYDIAAGAFIVERAGGVVCDFNGDVHFPEKGIISANSSLIKQLLENFK